MENENLRSRMRPDVGYPAYAVYDCHDHHSSLATPDNCCLYAVPAAPSGFWLFAESQCE